jgi:CubicO group peptidase (beta-lactamase class C family)
MRVVVGIVALVLLIACSAGSDGSEITGTTPGTTVATTDATTDATTVATTTTGEVAVTDDGVVEFRAVIDSVVDGRDEAGVPGLAVVVVRNGAVVLAEGFGTTPKGAWITSDTLLQVGSPASSLRG